QRNDVLAEPWKRVLRKIIKAKLTNGNYFEACVRKIKVNGLLMIPTPCRSQRRLNEWCRRNDSGPPLCQHPLGPTPPHALGTAGHQFGLRHRYTCCVYIDLTVAKDARP